MEKGAAGEVEGHTLFFPRPVGQPAFQSDSKVNPMKTLYGAKKKSKRDRAWGRERERKGGG